MNTSIIKSLIFIGLFLTINKAFAGTFTSNGAGGGLWNSASSWLFQSDADGIPDSNDNVIILSGDIIIWNTNSFCNNLTIDSGGEMNCNMSKNIQIYGNYQNSGTELGNGFYYFNGTDKSISGNGVFSSDSKWNFNKNTSIQSDVIVIKNSMTRFYHGAIVTNYGTVRVNGISNSGTTIGKWINATGSKLILRSHSLYVKLDASSFENTVKTIYGFTTAKLPISINNTYHHLEIGNSNYFVTLTTDINILGDLTISSGGDLNTNEYDIHLNGNFSNYQNLLQSDNSNLYMDGTSPQYLNSYVEPTAISNLIIDNASGVITDGYGKFTIANSLVINNGEFDLGKNLITLLSNENKTAYIGESGGTVKGTLTVERFVSDRNDGYSDMSSPVNSTTFYDWTDDLDLAFGPYIPSVTAPTCWGYDESLFDYYPIETFDDTLRPGKGYEIYLDNDGNNLTSFNATTLDLVGTPNLGNVSVPVTVDNDGWNLIGNPYACSIDWTHFRNNCGININAQFKYYDETINDFAIGNDGDTIASGQGFWIEVTEAGNITFQESNKVVGGNSVLRMAETIEETEEMVAAKTEWVKIQPTQLGIELELLSDNEEQISISIYNLAGQEIVSTVLYPENNNRMTITLPETPVGIYIITIIGGEKIESKKFYHN